jgi:hypothetical protein
MQRISREVRSYFSQYQILGLTDGKELLGPKFTSVSESKAPFRFRPSVIPIISLACTTPTLNRSPMITTF